MFVYLSKVFDTSGGQCSLIFVAGASGSLKLFLRFFQIPGPRFYQREGMDALPNRNNNASPVERLPGRKETVDSMTVDSTRADGTE